MVKLLYLLLQPKGTFKRIHFILEWPFSLLRWMTIPPCCHVCPWCNLMLHNSPFMLLYLQDGRWSIFHYLFAAFSPIPISFILLAISKDHWDAYTTTVGGAHFPLPIIIILIGKLSYYIETAFSIPSTLIFSSPTPSVSPSVLPSQRLFSVYHFSFY